MTMSQHHTAHPRRSRSHGTRRLIALAFSALVLGTTASSCHHDPTGVSGGPHIGRHSLLFVGNSLTFENNLPAVLSAIATQAGDTVDAWSVSLPDYALIDHYHTPTSMSAIASYRWEYVILQQGPSTLSISRDTLILATRLLEPYIRAVGAKPALFMVWPDASRKAFFDDCRNSYKLAADTVAGVFMPAGEAWRAVWAIDATLPLYSSDGYHPTVLGTYVAALEIFERVTGGDARNLPAVALAEGGRVIDVPAATVRAIQAAVHGVNQQYPVP